MLAFFTIISVIVITCNGLSIEKVSENHKSVTISGDTFEDKYDGDNLGKHGAIATKKKVKKRLASPLNYKVSVFEETDDYYERGGGDSDNNNEGTYESKDWSDLNREPININKQKTVLKNLDLTNIEGIDVIQKQSENFQSPKNLVKNEVIQKLLDSYEEEEKHDENPLIAIHTTDKNKISSKKPNDSDESNDYYDIHKTDEKIVHNPEKSTEDKLKTPKDDQDISYYDELGKQEDPYTTISKAVTTTEKIQAKRKKIKTNSAMNDYYDTAEKIRSDAEQAKEDKENEIKKLKILDSVDDLKERHSYESKLISEKFKEEELHREEFERNNPRSYLGNLDKYKKSSHHKPRGKVMSNYEDYEERPNFRDKYKPEPVSKVVTTAKSTTTAVSGKPPSGYRKMSVFRSPHLYMSREDADETTERTTRIVASPITAAESSDERISLIPEDGKEGEPTLFMPKKMYKNKKQKRPNDFSQDYIPQSKYSPNKNNKRTTLSMITDNYFPTTDISFTMVTESSNSMEIRTEHEEIELRPQPTEHKYAATEDIRPHRTTETDYYTEKNYGESDYSTKKNGDSEYVEKKNRDGEVDMSGVGSDFNNIITNENFDENSTDRYNMVEPKHPEIEPEISLARTEETTELSSDSSEDLTRPTIIIQARDDLAPESSDHQREDYHNGKEGGGRRHESEHDREYKEEGKKHYEHENEEEITGKGLHDVQKDINKYDSHEQAKESYGEDIGHSARHDHSEAGKKHAEYEETGKHSKGHSTKGSHDVHKKEEYEKKEEFFDYSGEEEDKGKKIRDIKSNYHTVTRGGAGRSKPRRAYAPGDFAKAQLKKPTRNNTKEKWIHHHGYPARTNNLILIDRRRDLNWPHYG